jgi:NAD(P)-dependent dehydrogenase (short-subunit alcohol dehydrogenase family)
VAILDRFRLDGRVVVLTGASSGLGVGTAVALAEAGASLALGARRLDRVDELAAQLRARGTDVVARRCDVTDPDDCAALVDAAVAELGAVHGLVNNAGVSSAAPATREAPAQFRAVLDVNLAGAYWMAQACGRVMPAGSSIVNVSSVLGLTTMRLPQAAYAASKAGLLGLTRDLAQQWTGRKGIRVNAVAPGFFTSEMTDEYDPDYLTTMVEQRVLMGRLGDVEEHAAAVVYLLSPASSYVTGTVLAVDGGLLVT